MHKMITAAALAALLGATALVVPTLPSLAQHSPVHVPDPDEVETAQVQAPSPSAAPEKRIPDANRDNQRAAREACAPFKGDRSKYRACLEKHRARPEPKDRHQKS